MELHGNEGYEALESCIDLGNIQKILSQILDRIQLYSSNKNKSLYLTITGFHLKEFNIDIYLQFY